MAKCHEDRKAKERRRRREAERVRREILDYDSEAWLCACGEWVEYAWHCPKCHAEPPQGCPCDGHDSWDEDFYDNPFAEEDYYAEPIGSCEWCGTNLYEDDDPELCDQCVWHAQQNAGEEQSGMQPIM